MGLANMTRKSRVIVPVISLGLRVRGWEMGAPFFLLIAASRVAFQTADPPLRIQPHENPYV